MSPVAIILYLWLFAAAIYWSYRLYTRFQADADGVDEETKKAEKKKRKAIDDLPDPSSASLPKIETTLERTRRERAEAEAARVSAGERETSLVEQTIRHELDSRAQSDTSGDDAIAIAPTDKHDGWSAGATATPPAATEATAASGRGGFFKPKNDADAGTGDAPAPTVAELLAGVEMPCDLSPWIGDSDRIDPHHVVFLTTGHDAGDVGAAFADELERLGYTLTTTSETELSAKKPAGTLHIIMHPQAATETDREGNRRFPSAPGGSVAISIRT